MNIKNLNLSALLVASSLWSCNTGQLSEKPDLQPNEAIQLENMDTTVSAREDFFQYVNGGWLKSNEIPKEENSWGVIKEVVNRNNLILLEVLNEASESEVYKQGSDERKAANFYQIGMDSLLAEQHGIEPLKPYLEKIAAVKDKNELQKIVAEVQTLGVTPFFNFFIDQDLKQSEKQVFYLYQGGLGMPNREYYTKDDQKSKDIRNEYINHASRMFELIGIPEKEAKANAQVVMKIENKLALASMTPVQLRDWEAQNNKKSLKELNQLSPSINWPSHFSNLGIPNLDALIVAQPNFIKEVEKVIKSSGIDDLKTYVQWRMIAGTAPYLHHELVKESFRFNNTVIYGTEDMRPRWKRVLNKTDDAMCEALGKLYVARAFPPEAKESALKMVENIKEAFKERIEKLDWMSDSTKAQALVKLAAFKVKIGYPDEWRDYSNLEVGKESYLQNVFSTNKFEHKRQLKKIGNPVDPNEWFMSPPTLNAYYNPSSNEIVFPAGILQPPLYDYQADAAVN